MTFNAKGFVTAHHMGTIAGAAGETRNFHTYLTNDDAPTVEGANYFNDKSHHVKTGDVIMASLDLDGSPTVRFYIVTSNSAGVVAVSQATTVVIGDQTTIAALTDSSGGAADGTLEAVGATNSGDVSGAINNNFAELAAKVNAVRTALIDSGLLASS